MAKYGKGCRIIGRLKFSHGWFIMFVKVMSSAQTEDECGSELAHGSIHPNGCIGRMPANEKNRRFFECAL